MTPEQAERFLIDFVNGYEEYDGDNVSTFIRLHALALAGDSSAVCRETNGFHQVSDGSCDLCGQKNLTGY